jgi:hypothetical protein
LTRCAPNSRKALAVCILLLLGGGPLAAAPPDRTESHARRFVTLALTLTRLDGQEIDAYFGPRNLKPPNGGATPSPDSLRDALLRLRADLKADAPSPRRDRLAARVDHLIALVGILRSRLSFTQEARQVYGVTLPAQDTAALSRARAELARLLPGDGSLSARVDAFRDRFLIPEARRKAVFQRTLAECRARTAAYWPLPRGEKLDVEWRDGADAAWHRYAGRGHSMLRVNPAAVAYPGTALDVACHEAYPGHHAQFLMMAAQKGGVAVEDTVVILRSPEQVLREGAASYGVDLAFPQKDRVAFTRDILFPMAGFAPAEAEKYVTVHRLVGELALSVMPILRDYRDGKMRVDKAAAALERDALISSPRALLQFTDALGAYVTGYTVTRDLVRDCVEARDAKGDDRWAVLRAIVAKLDLSVLDPHSCRRRLGI